jgi:hypothetical protein
MGHGISNREIKPLAGRSRQNEKDVSPSNTENNDLQVRHFGQQTAARK